MTTHTVRQIVQAAAEVSGLSVETILGPSQHRYISSLRQIVMVLAREQGKSWPLIGRELRRDHTTIVHGCKMIAARLENGDRRLECLIREIREKLDASV